MQNDRACGNAKCALVHYCTLRVEPIVAIATQRTFVRAELNAVLHSLHLHIDWLLMDAVKMRETPSVLVRRRLENNRIL